MSNFKNWQQARKTMKNGRLSRLGSNKYNATKTEYNGVRYDSMAELGYAKQLVLTGEQYIYHPEPIVIVRKFKNIDKVHRRRIYTPDFAILDGKGNVASYVDVKSKATMTEAASLRMAMACVACGVPMYIAERNSRGSFDVKLF